MIDPLDIMTVAQVADRLKCGPRRVRQLIQEGKLAAFKLGDTGHWKITTRSVADLFGFEQERSHAPTYYRRRAQAAMTRMGYN